MKEQLALLRELQTIDLDLDEIKQKKEVIQADLSESSQALEHLSKDLESQREELEEIRKLRRQKQEDIRETQETLKERKKRLLNVGSTKEYNAVEKEIDALQKSAEQTEEEILRLAEVIDTSEKSLTLKEDQTKQLGDSIAEQEAEAEGQLNSFDRKLKKMTKRTEQARQEVSKRYLYKYDFIRSRRPGLAICAAKDGHCTSCYMALPPQLFIQIQRGETLETCPSCQRILYFWEDDPEAFEKESALK